MFYVPCKLASNTPRKKNLDYYILYFNIFRKCQKWPKIFDPTEKLLIRSDPDPDAGRSVDLETLEIGSEKIHSGSRFISNI